MREAFSSSFCRVLTSPGVTAKRPPPLFLHEKAKPPSKNDNLPFRTAFWLEYQGRTRSTCGLCGQKNAPGLLSPRVLTFGGQETASLRKSWPLGLLSCPQYILQTCIALFPSLRTHTSCDLLLTPPYRIMHFSLVFSVSTLLLTTLVATTRAVESCYFPSGLEIVPSVNATYEPCNEQAGAISQCCPTNQGCSANGLCVDVDGQYSRGGCTDSTFGSPYCLDLCTTVLVCPNLQFTKPFLYRLLLTSL